jgi:hypothetical protein
MRLLLRLALLALLACASRLAWAAHVPANCNGRSARPGHARCALHHYTGPDVIASQTSGVGALTPYQLQTFYNVASRWAWAGNLSIPRRVGAAATAAPNSGIACRAAAQPRAAAFASDASKQPTRRASAAAAPRT